MERRSRSNERFMIIGIDDTDSRKGMCTTYLCATLIKELKKYGYGEVSIPRLARLNPCIPFKTRGNGAVSFEIKTSTEKEEEVKEVVIEGVSEMSELSEEETNPGVVFMNNNALVAINEKENGVATLMSFYENAVREVLKIEDAYEVIFKLNLECFGLKKKRGIIGALAAAAFLFLQKNNSNHYNFTYELLTYRQRERWGTPRFIDENSVWKADEATYPLTWDTVDVANKKIIFAPHSPCPVLFGIRGDDVEAIYRTYNMIRTEPVKQKTLFITNQGTDSHLKRPNSSKEKLEDYHSYELDGVVNLDPYTIEGGHVVFSIREKTSGRNIECIAYEPTKGFRAIIRKLRVDDEITVYGSLKNKTINLEKIEMRKLHLIELKTNPKCPICRKSMESAGKLQGYRCKKCRTYCKEKEVQVEKRDIENGLYEVPPVARRHISKPLIRIIMKGKSKKIHPSR